MSDLSQTEYDCFNKAQRDSVKIIEHPEIKRLKDQIEQKDKQLDRQEAAMFRMKEEISKHLMTINKLRQKLGRGL